MAMTSCRPQKRQRFEAAGGNSDVEASAYGAQLISIDRPLATVSVLKPHHPSGLSRLWAQAHAGDPVYPFVFLRGALSPDLVAYLLEDSSVRSVVKADVTELNLDAIFRGHKARCFHAVGGVRRSDQVEMAGFEYDGLHPPAGRRLRAFAEAMRVINSAGVAELAPVLALELGRIFGCVTVQHFVDRSEPCDAPPGEVLGWHVDSDASIIHLSLSLAGERCLLLRASTESDANNQEDFAVSLRPGDVYLSSPAFFLHSVCKAKKAEAVAIQMRLAQPPPDKAASGTTTSNFAEWSEHVARTLQGLPWRLPSFDEVYAVQSRHDS